jgi:hypothetical protein
MDVLRARRDLFFDEFYDELENVVKGIEEPI